MTKRQIQNRLRQAGIPASNTHHSGYILKEYAESFEIAYFAFKSDFVEKRLGDIQEIFSQAIRCGNILVISK